MAVPGQVLRRLKANVAQCDHHQEMAVAVIAGESDSLGTEEVYVCQACLDEAIGRRHRKRFGTCHFCKSQDVEVHHFRDPDEGRNGPVYDACEPCTTRIVQKFIGELDE